MKYNLMRFIKNIGPKIHEVLDEELNSAYISLLVANNTIEPHAFYLVDILDQKYFPDGGGTGFEIPENIGLISLPNLMAIRDKSLETCNKGSKLIKKNNKQLKERMRFLSKDNP